VFKHDFANDGQIDGLLNRRRCLWTPINCHFRWGVTSEI